MMNTNNLLYFVVSTLILIVSFENIILISGELYFASNNYNDLIISLIISAIVFAIGHLIIINNKIMVNAINILKCVYIMLMLNAIPFLLSDVIEIWVYLFLVGKGFENLDYQNKEMFSSLFLFLLSILSLLVLKYFKIKRCSTFISNKRRGN